MQEFLYEPHLHTAETSRCGRIPAAAIVDRYQQLGFSGIVTTDHLHNTYLSQVDPRHNWDEAVDAYMKGFKAAFRRGQEIGLDVIFGIELRFPERDNDYLIYGVDEAWLRANPYLCGLSPEEFFAAYGHQVLIIHAHPYRDGNEWVCEQAIHGAEIFNGNPRHDNHNEKALALCERHPEYYRLAGSDCHRDGDEGRCGILLPQRVKDSFEYKNMIESQNFKLWIPESPQTIAADSAMRIANPHMQLIAKRN